MKRLDPPDQARVRQAIDFLAANPQRRDIQKLKGRQDEWRLRVGVWRVFFAYDPARRALHILGVRHRREAYRAR
jgi:mRNA interferase RelE/StbE